MTKYPVVFNINRPQTFDRTQVLLRLLVLLILALLGGVIGWALGLTYLALPVLAAILISQHGSAQYLRDRGGPVNTVLTWYLALYSYLSLLTDRFPTEKPEEVVTFEVAPSGSPTVGSALLRLIYSFPSAVVLAVLGIVGVIVWVIAMISVLVSENYADGLYDFQLGIMRWHARLLGYHSSLVDEYPPFALDTGPETAIPPSAESLPGPV
jgi:hypothetical protein